MSIFIFHRGNYTMYKYSKREFPAQNRICTFKGDYTQYLTIDLSHTQKYLPCTYVLLHMLLHKNIFYCKHKLSNFSILYLLTYKFLSLQSFKLVYHRYCIVFERERL